MHLGGQKHRWVTTGKKEQLGQRCAFVCGHFRQNILMLILNKTVLGLGFRKTMFNVKITKSEPTSLKVAA